MFKSDRCLIFIVFGRHSMSARTLIMTACHPRITDEHQRLLAYIDGCNFNPYFERGVHLGLIRSNADQSAMIYALKQYYAICMLDPGNGHVISPVLDPLWYAHMLSIEEYREFCVEVVGEYMHHTPLTKDDVEANAKVEKLYDYTLECLCECFTTVDERMWPPLANDRLTCLHRGNETLYPKMQAIRVFNPIPCMAI